MAARDEFLREMATRPERMKPSPGHFLVKLYTPDGHLRRHPTDAATRASAQIALYWDTYYRRVLDGVGLEGLHGMRASEALPRLEYAVRKLGKQSSEDMLTHRQLSPAEKAGNCLVMFINWCRNFPDDVLEVLASPENTDSATDRDW